MAFSTFTDNTPSKVQTGDFGLKLSKPTFNALNTAGQNLLFSSSWPSLQIAFDITIANAAQLATFSSSAQGFAIPHNLGYPPLAFYWHPPQDGSGVSNAALRAVASVDNKYAYVNVPATEQT